MKAMILAAGLGTRLRPLTSRRPKALVPVGNRPVIDRIISYLKGHGVTEIVVNAHHHADQIVRHLDRGRPFGIPVEVRVEGEILGTGGGIRNTQDFWDDAPFVVINGDTLTDLDLSAAYRAHMRGGGPATLVLHHCEPYSQIRIDQAMNIADISPENRPGWLAFTGIHIIEPRLLREIPEGAFSGIMDSYRDLMARGDPPKAYLSTGHYWREVGSTQSYVSANREALSDDRFLLAPGCRIAASAQVLEWAVIGRDSILEEGAVVKRSILWDNVRIKKGVKVIDAVVTSRRQLDADLVGGIL